MMADIKCLQQLKNHEGFRMKPYLDTEGVETCGYGYNMEANPDHLTQEQLDGIRRYGISPNLAYELLEARVRNIESVLRTLPYWHILSEPRQAVLINMAYNMGTDGLLDFKRTLALIERKKFSEAAMEMLSSKWADQVKTRSIELALQMARGEWVFV